MLVALSILLFTCALISATFNFPIPFFQVDIPSTTKLETNNQQIEDKTHDGVELSGIGSVVDVINGNAKIITSPIDLSPFRSGFQAGSPKGKLSIGEFISFNGIGYTRSTKPADAGKLITGKVVYTNGAVFLPRNVKSGAKLQLESVTLAEMCQRSVSKVGRAVYFSGFLDLELLEGTGISKAPIENERIFDNKSKYYKTESWAKKNVLVACVGCAAILANEKKQLRKELGVVLYDNPNESPANLLFHVHALELSKPIKNQSEIKKEIAINVHHLFGKTKIRSGSIELFPIENIQGLPIKKTN